MNSMLSMIRFKKGKGLAQLKQWRLCRFPGLLAAVLLLVMPSISLAQGNTWSTKLLMAV